MAPAARPPARDLTVLAVPFYFGAMAVEYVRLRQRARTEGPSAGEYERRDTVASLTMGTASLVAPFVVPRRLAPTTDHPRPCRSSAHACPMPDDAPVTSTTSPTAGPPRGGGLTVSRGGVRTARDRCRGGGRGPEPDHHPGSGTAGHR